jgi:nitrite reductase/ring-hydroxylating ferredoxin subunit/DMSO/TMAO reductase YedYZ heme-binding membrane subunit
MAHAYQAVLWNPQKRRYDATLAAGIVGYLGLFIGLGFALQPNATIETLLIRGFGTASLLLLNGILCIGPLCRLDRRFLPLLYNRRHLGVAMFALALAHAALATIQFHALGDANPFVSVLTSNPRLDSIAQFPFELFGGFALLVLFLMAATSHDFWLANLSPPVWKALHMCVYAAYAALLLHVALGALQSDTNPVLATLLFAGFALVIGLHLVAGSREARADRPLATTPERDGFVELCSVGEIPEKRARIFPIGGERVAVFRYDGLISALSNVCRHQNGPLGEGLVVDGCVVCPWHGYQYRPASGTSPPPFDDKVATYRVRVVAGRVWLDPRALPPGTPVEPARIDVDATHG